MTPPVVDDPCVTVFRMIRVVVVDDNAEMRDLLRLALRRDPRFEIVAEAADGQEGVAACATNKPDVVILDIFMPGLDGLDAAVEIKRRSPRTKVVMYSSQPIEGIPPAVDACFEKTAVIRNIGTKIFELCAPAPPPPAPQPAPRLTARPAAVAPAPPAPPAPRPPAPRRTSS